MAWCGYSSVANPDLSPETISTYELVLEQYARGNLRLAGSAFLLQTADLVSVHTSTGLFENLDQVKAHGIELEKRLKSGFNLRSSSTLQEPRDDTTDRLPTNSGRHLAKINADFPVGAERLSGGVEVQDTSKRLTLAGRNFRRRGAIAVARGAALPL